MIDASTRKEIISLIKREVVPAVGCTEPAAVALCVAKATEILGTGPSRLELRLSANIIKNAMGVGIPGTGMIGLPIAIALGAIIGKPEYGLEVLKDVNPDLLEKAKKYIKEDRIKIVLADDAPSNLYIDVVAKTEDDVARAVIAFSHTGFIHLSKNTEVILDKKEDDEKGSESEDIKLTLAMVYDFATTSPIDEISFILEAKELNLKAAELALKENYGHSLGSTMMNFGKAYFGDTPLEHMIRYTTAACDARMGGASIPVMSNSGSGNQGITATMPVVVFARDTQADTESTIRALILSNLTSIYIKQSLGRLSALCGCVVASTGASAALVYLMGGGYEQICSAVKNMVANLTGMICDGAKPSCAMKISSGVYTAMISAMLAVNDKCVSSAEGIVCDDVDQTIKNLTSIGREAMHETDRLVLHMMTHK